MGKKICFLRDIIYVVMCVLMILLLYFYLGEIFGRHSNWNLFAVLYIVGIFVLDYFLRKHVTHAIPFFGIRLLAAGGIVLVTQDLIEIVLLVIVYFIFFSTGLGFWKADSESEKRLFAIDMPMEAVFLFVGVYIHASINMSNKLATFAYLGGIAYIMLHLARKYLDKFISVVYNLEDNPASLRASFQMNSVFVFLLLIAIFLLIVAINFMFNNDSFNFVGKGIRYLAALLFGWLARLSNRNVVPQEEPTTLPEDPEQATVIVEQTETFVTNFTPNTNPFMNALFQIFEIAVYIGMVVLIIYSIYRFFKYYLHRNRQNNDLVEDFIEKDVVTKLPKKKPVQAQKSGSNAEKIRKLYRKTVSLKMKQERALHIRYSSTPTEIQNAITECSEGSKEFGKLTELYWKARYSQEKISSKEVSLAKSLKL